MTDRTPPSPAPIDDDELHAYVDGHLPSAQARRLEQRLAGDPAAAARVAAWKAQRDMLRRHLAATLDESLPPPLERAAQSAAMQRGPARWNPWLRWGGMAAGLLVAFGAGWVGRGASLENGIASASAGAGGFARQAVAAHVVYAPEVRHPVEVEAAQHEHLVQWLSRRVGRPLRVPQLTDLGFELVGGRLLPGEAGARAQFMFQDAGGQRITLYVGAVAASSAAGKETAFRFVREGETSSFYWIDRGFGYALAGNLPRDRLLAIATTVHGRL